MNFTRKYIPSVFLKFCEEAKSGAGGMGNDLEVEIKIKFKGQMVANDKLINKLKRKMTLEIKKSKKWREQLEGEAEE